VPGDGGTGRFSGVTTFVGSMAGSAGLVAGPVGGYDLRGQGPRSTLDLSAQPAEVTVSMPAPRRCAPRPDCKSGSASAQQRLRPRDQHHAVSASGPAHLLPGPRRENL
jgi:hypothetical protein